MQIGQGMSFETFYRLLRSGKIYSLNVTSAASVGNISQIQLETVSGAFGIRTILFGFRINSADTQVFLTAEPAQLATDAGAGVERSNLALASVAHVRTGSNAAVLGTKFDSIKVTANVDFFYQEPRGIYIGYQSSRVGISNNAVNLALTATIIWGEMPDI